jgi:hypothetical protein
MKKFILAALVMVIEASAVGASADTGSRTNPSQKVTAFAAYSGFMDGATYRKLTEQQRLAYVTGVHDGFMLAPWIARSNHTMTGGIAACDERLRMTNALFVEIADKYVGDHPERWSEGANLLIFNALQSACKTIGISFD